MRNDTVLILVLALLAVLLSGMVFTSWQDNQAAAATPDHQGDYIMVTGTRSDSNDLLYVIDVPHQKLIVYGVDGTNNRMIVADTVNLAGVFQ